MTIYESRAPFQICITQRALVYVFVFTLKYAVFVGKSAPVCPYTSAQNKLFLNAYLALLLEIFFALFFSPTRGNRGWNQGSE